MKSGLDEILLLVGWVTFLAGASFDTPLTLI